MHDVPSERVRNPWSRSLTEKRCEREYSERRLTSPRSILYSEYTYIRSICACVGANFPIGRGYVYTWKDAEETVGYSGIDEGRKLHYFYGAEKLRVIYFGSRAITPFLCIEVNFD